MNNPWNVESIWVFSHLHCPECTFNTQDESVFQHHAVDTHPLSFVLFHGEFQGDIGFPVKQEPVDDYNESFEYDFSETSNENESKGKGQRTFSTLAKKLEVVRFFENGMRCSKIAKLTKIPESTVRAICKQKEAIKNHGISGNFQGSKKKIPNRTRTMIKMEKLMLAWILDFEEKGARLETSQILAKAKLLYLEIKDTIEDKTEKEMKENFLASTGWFNKFKRRFKVCGYSENSDIKQDNADEVPMKTDLNDESFEESIPSNNVAIKQELIEPLVEISTGNEPKEETTGVFIYFSEIFVKGWHCIASPLRVNTFFEQF